MKTIQRREWTPGDALELRELSARKKMPHDDGDVELHGSAMAEPIASYLAATRERGGRRDLGGATAEGETLAEARTRSLFIGREGKRGARGGHVRVLSPVEQGGTGEREIGRAHV